MKKAFLLGLTAIIVLLASCADASVSYRLGESDVSTQYNINIVSSDLESRSYAQDIKEYWESLGFAAEITQSSEGISITGFETQNYGDRHSAADAFSSLFTAKDSLFDGSSFQYTPSFEYDDYFFSGSVSLSDIIRQSELQDIPKAYIQEFMKSAETGTYKLILSLPGQIVDTNADETDDNVCTWYLAYGEKSDIYLKTRLYNTDTVSRHDELLKKERIYGILFRSLIAAAGLMVLIIITLVIVRISKNRRR